VESKTKKRKSGGSKRRVALVGLMLTGVASVWYTHRTAISRGEWMSAFAGETGTHGTSSDTSGGVHRVVAEGKMVSRPGAEVTVGAEIAGRIVRVLVDEKSVVRKGDLIAEIDVNEQVAAAAEARARIAEVDADIRYFEPKVARAEKMAPSGAVSVIELEQWRRDLEAARARRKAAEATVRRLEINVTKGQIRAPLDGTVIARFAQPGQMVEPLGKVVTIADLSQARLEAEVNEFDADGLAVGALATATAEGYPGRQWRARVEEIPDVVAGRQLRPQDPGRPSDTGVLLVKLVFLEPVPFKLGQRVDSLIDLSGAKAAVSPAVMPSTAPKPTPPTVATVLPTTTRPATPPTVTNLLPATRPTTKPITIVTLLPATMPSTRPSTVSGAAPPTTSPVTPPTTAGVAEADDTPADD